MMDASKEQVKRLIQTIRRRWRRRALIQGAALTAIILLLLATGLLIAYTRFEIPVVYQGIGALAGLVIVLGVGVQYILRPALRHISDRQIALYIEEKIPELEDRLNSAVEISGGGTLSREDSALIDRLIDDAARRTEEIPITTVVERGKESMLAYSAAGITALFLLIGYLSLDDLTRTLQNIQQLPTAVTENTVEVRPGNSEVEQGNSQEIIAELRSETDQNVVLHFRQGDGEWEQTVMQRGLDQPAYLHEFQNIQEPIQYTVEVGDRRVGPFTLSLYEFPDVAQIDVTYHYPSYTNRPDRTEENVGDIRGLKGSTVTVSIETTGDVAEATIDRENGAPIPLEPAGDRRYEAQFPLEDKDFYRIQLTDEQQKQNKFPRRYRIQPVPDEKPYISFSDPGRDIRANAIEEVLVAAEVQDDFGVKDVRLQYSINGSEEQTASLAEPETANRREVTGEHLFFLEEFSLEPGDVISYYIEADDHYGETSPEVTDMYFIEVMPFDQRFRQVNSPGGGQGGGQPSGATLSQQQIITATWKLHRQQDEISTDEFEESRKDLIQGQSNLRENIEQRINSTAFSTELQNSEKHQQIVEALRNAVQEIKQAEAELSDGNLRAALTPERRALNHLLKAEAANDERRLALQRGQSSGGGSAATEERMSELMDLELDISKDKYEMQEQSGRSQQQQTSDALDRIKELAQKQEQLLEQQQPDLQGQDNSRMIDRLEREQQELRRQTEDLTQQMRQQARRQGQQNERMNRQLERITEQMKEAGRSLRQQDVQQARSQQQQALNELRRMQQKLELENTDDLRQQLDQLTEQFDNLKQQEEELGQEIRQAVDESQENQGRLDQEQLRDLAKRRSALQEEAEQLSATTRNLQEQAESNQPELASKLDNLRQHMEETGLREKMQDSEQALQQGWLDYARRQQEDIEQSMEELSSDMQGFRNDLPESQEEQLTRSLENVRDLQEQMEEIQRQAENLRQSQNQQGQNQQAQNQAQNSQQSGGQSSQNQQSQQSRAQSQRLQQQLQRAQESLEELRQQLDGNPEAQQQLNQMESYLKRGRADHMGVLFDEDSAEQFFSDNIFTPLSDLELHLARQLDTIAMENKLYGARRGDVPRRYQQLVEQYYERLSKSANE